ncbi:MAG: phosphonatase-like hydrolase [Actinomycetota bacterium]
MIELVALDMAGTTIDDHGLVYDALRESVTETGATVDPVHLQTWMGTDKLTAIGALLPLGGGDASAAPAAFERFRVILADSYRANPPVALPGVEEALRFLRELGLKIALTTGFSDDVAYPILDAVGWTVGVQLDAVVTTSDVTAGRPAPYLIHHAMEKTAVTDVRTVLAAGDTAVDLQAARNAGVVAVGVLSGALGRDDLQKHPHDHILDSVVDLLDLPEVSRR